MILDRTLFYMNNKWNNKPKEESKKGEYIYYDPDVFSYIPFLNEINAIDVDVLMLRKVL